MSRQKTPEHRAKIAAALRGKITSDETRAKISAANTGKVRTAEARARMSVARKVYWARRRALGQKAA